MKDLNPKQYEDIYFEYDEPFLGDKKKKNEFLIYYCIAAFVIIIILGFFIKIPREIRLEFELKGGSKELIGQYPDKVFIIDQHVKMGDYIKRGMPIVTISSEKIIQFLEELTTIDSDFYKFETSEKKLYEEKKHHRNSKLLEIHKNLKHVKSYKENLDERSKLEQKNLEYQLSISLKDLNRNQTLFEKGIISKRNLETIETNHQEKEYLILNSKQRFQNEVLLIKTKETNLHTELLKLYQEKDVDSLKRIEKLVALVKQKQNIEEKLKHSYGNCSIQKNGLTIKSTSDGKINLITEEESQIESGKILWKIEYEKSEYKIVCEANSHQIGSIKKGQLVYLRYNSFPYLYYGTMEGIIEQTSLSTKNNQKYLVNITINNKGNLGDKVIKGMKGDASIIIENLPVFNYLFKKLLKPTNKEN